ncbi:MAG: hypothetical protein FWF59_01035 [Turicibacter sp.]|nr:hypothetical protein [Turicibacter sp.]
MPLTRTRKNEGDEVNLGDAIYNALDETEPENIGTSDYELAYGLPEKAVRLVMKDDTHAIITFDNGEDKLFDISPYNQRTMEISEHGTHFLLDDLDGSLELPLDTVYFDSIPL